MKHYKLFVLALVLVASSLFVTCQRFEPATIEISSVFADGKLMSGNATIIDDGGCDYFVEQGYCYSLFDTLSATETYTTMVPVAYNSKEYTFSWSRELPLADTTYYVCAYVKTNAGIAYSEKKSINTSIQ